MRVVAEDFGNGARHNFWLGYEMGLVGRLPERDASEFIRSGFAQGHCEREGWFRLTTWQARIKRTRQFLKVLYALIRSFRQGLEFGQREKNGVLTISVLLGKWE
jgi:hypothetical protein